MQTLIKFSRENETVILPTRREGDAGFDLYVDKQWLKSKGRRLLIKSGETALIPTGLRSIIDREYYAQIQERGSTGIKAMKYGAGVIDSSFRGIWNVIITNCNKEDIVIYDDDCKIPLYDTNINYSANKGIAQFLLLPVPKIKIEEVSINEILKEQTERGEGKLGDSGK
jgi:dUTP pyrophosphatase